MKIYTPLKTWKSKKEMLIAAKWFFIGYFLAGGVTMLAVFFVWLIVRGICL